MPPSPTVAPITDKRKPNLLMVFRFLTAINYFLDFLIYLFVNNTIF